MLKEGMIVQGVVREINDLGYGIIFIGKDKNVLSACFSLPF